MPQAIAVSRGGTACATFADCSDIIASGLNFDYNGPTGVLTLDANGDQSVATFVTFGFDDSGRSVFRGNLGVFSAP
jgi:branched-chain amino acid transport system substrate-binding protein